MIVNWRTKKLTRGRLGHGVCFELVLNGKEFKHLKLLNVIV